MWEASECGEYIEGARVLFRKPCQREYVENMVVELERETFRQLVRKE